MNHLYHNRCGTVRQILVSGREGYRHGNLRNDNIIYRHFADRRTFPCGRDATVALLTYLIDNREQLQ